MNSQQNTLDYYNNHAQSFIDSTYHVDMSEAINTFTNKIPTKGHILDVGCGSGRDTKQFLDLGFHVTAFDVSEQLAKLASEKIQHPVLHMDLKDMTWENQFDGVWALASLLHLEKKDIPQALEKCIRALKEDGFFFTSFKLGSGESADEKGRHFSYFSVEQLNDILLEIPDIKQFQVVLSAKQDSLGRDISWINVEVIKGPQLNLVNKSTNRLKF